MPETYSFASQRDAVQELNDIGNSVHVIEADRARAIAEPFGVDVPDDATGRLADMVPLYWGDGDTEALNVFTLLEWLVESIGEEPKSPVWGGHGRTARDRFDKNMPILREHVGLPPEGDDE